MEKLFRYCCWEVYAYFLRVNKTLASCRQSVRGRTSICRKSCSARALAALSAVRLGRRSRPAGIPRRSDTRFPGVGSSREEERSSFIKERAIRLARGCANPDSTQPRSRIIAQLCNLQLIISFSASLFTRYDSPAPRSTSRRARSCRTCTRPPHHRTWKYEWGLGSVKIPQTDYLDCWGRRLKSLATRRLLFCFAHVLSEFYKSAGPSLHEFSSRGCQKVGITQLIPKCFAILTQIRSGSTCKCCNCRRRCSRSG